MGKKTRRNTARKVSEKKKVARNKHHEPDRGDLFQEILWYVIAETQHCDNKSEADRFYGALQAIFGGDKGGRPQNQDRILLHKISELMKAKPESSVRSAVRKIVEQILPPDVNLRARGEHHREAMCQRLERKYRKIRNFKPALFQDEIEAWNEEKRQLAREFMNKHWL